jgi:DNA (cytosine-5)-methyltransferase 1
VTAYYNEIDPYAAQWLRNLIAAGHIAPGDVDERDIRDVRPDDLRDYTQSHFFAGIGGWSIALRLAGWPDDRPVWTGSCPCQPFSAAGGGKAADDERHLWPSWAPLIRECRPGTVFGEQVEAAIGWGWLDTVFADLEAQGYACGAAVLPACGVGAPHIRNRLWFVGTASSAGSGRDGRAVPRAEGEGAGERCRTRCVANEPKLAGSTGRMDDANGKRWPFRVRDARNDGTAGRTPARQAAIGTSPWSNTLWLPCTDGKARPTQPGLFPLAHGIQRRPSKLRAYGNAIVPQVAAEFIRAAT